MTPPKPDAVNIARIGLAVAPERIDNALLSGNG